MNSRPWQRAANIMPAFKIPLLALIILLSILLSLYAILSPDIPVLAAPINITDIELTDFKDTIAIGETVTLKATIISADAPSQTIKFSSSNTGIVTITPEGKMTGIAAGTAKITAETDSFKKTFPLTVLEEADTPAAKILSKLLKDIADATETAENGAVTIGGQECERVRSIVLKELYGTNTSLTITYPEYSITLHGKDIKNINNEFNTKIFIAPGKHEGIPGLKVHVNNGSNLPGKIHIKLLNQEENYSHLYLLDEYRNIYKELDTLHENNEFSIDCDGKYLLTQSKITRSFISWQVIVVLGVIALGLVVAYIAVKKRHWFW